MEKAKHKGCQADKTWRSVATGRNTGWRATAATAPTPLCLKRGQTILLNHVAKPANPRQKEANEAAKCVSWQTRRKCQKFKHKPSTYRWSAKMPEQSAASTCRCGVRAAHEEEKIRTPHVQAGPFLSCLAFAC